MRKWLPAIAAALLVGGVVFAQAVIPSGSSASITGSTVVTTGTITAGDDLVATDDVTVGDDLVVTDSISGVRANLSTKVETIFLDAGVVQAEQFNSFIADGGRAIQLVPSAEISFNYPTSNYYIRMDPGNFRLVLETESGGRVQIPTDPLEMGNNLIFTGAGNALQNSATGAAVIVDDPQGFRITTQTLLTCGDGSPSTEAIPGQIMYVAPTTSAPSKLCVCRQSDTSSPVYAWMNVLTMDGGSGIGDATTCN